MKCFQHGYLANCGWSISYVKRLHVYLLEPLRLSGAFRKQGEHRTDSTNEKIPLYLIGTRTMGTWISEIQVAHMGSW